MNRLFVILSLTLFFNMNAQVAQRICGTPVLPAEYENWVQSITPVPGKYGNASTQSVFNIPVIVHIIHDNEPVNSAGAFSGNNINAAQVIDQLNILNMDYNGINADTSLIPAVFKPVLGKFQVNFCLAVVNPTGGILAEPGIDRINRVAKGWNSFPYSQNYVTTTVKPNSIWDPNKYFNIWIAPLSGGLLGYATFPNPGTSGLSGLSAPFGNATSDGVVILNSSFGSIGTAQFGSYNKGRTATHEIGHWMGLRHIWGDANCGNDYCNDTPPAQTANYGCPTFPYKLGTCTGNTTGEMTMNYMDYTDDACLYMFTADQKNRAQLILTNSPIRAALLTSTVCNLPTAGNDIGITFVAKPTYSQAVNCINYIDPVVSITNFGSTVLTGALFTFDVDGINTQTLSWTGSAAPNTSFTVALTQIAGLSTGPHVFHVMVSAPNAGIDNNLSNNTNQQQFSVSTSTFSLTAPSGTVCQGNSIVLTAAGATSYTWNTGINTASISLSPSVTTVYTVTGHYGSCTQSKTLAVNVQSAPALTLNKTNVCENVPTVITASGASSYSWNTGAASAAITVTLSAPAVYTVTGFTSAGCAGTETFAVMINPVPTGTLVAMHVSCGSCSDATIAAVVSGGTAPYTYLWQPGNATTATLTNAGAMCYSATVTDALGCQFKESSCVSFDTGIFTQHALAATIKVVPNPGPGQFEITLEPQGNKTIEITDAVGRRLRIFETQAGTLTLDITMYPAGVYYVRINSGKDFAAVKLLKE